MQLWTNYSKSYYKLTRLSSYQELISLFIQKIKEININPKYILDLGCGCGVLAKELSSLFVDSTIHAVDFDEGMLSVAKVFSNADNIKFIQKNANEIYSINQKYDLIVMNNSFYTIDQKESLIENLKPLMTDSAYLIISDPIPPEQYSYTKIISPQFKSVKGFFNFLELIPDLVNIYFINKEIDKQYNRYTYDKFVHLFNKHNFKIISHLKSYEGQANMFIVTLKK